MSYEKMKERMRERTGRGRDEERKVERKIFLLPPSPYACTCVLAGEEEGEGSERMRERRAIVRGRAIIMRERNKGIA